jgi:hypothetical protein
MKIALRATAILLLTLVVGPASVFAAWTYTFRNVARGDYPSEQQGTVVVDGSRWRIDFAKNPDDVTFLTAIIGSEAGAVAVNDERQTWFPVESTSPIDARLFTFGLDPNEASDIRVVLEPVAASTENEAGQWRVTFSYSIRTRSMNEPVHGRVWGEIGIWTFSEAPAVSLPWKPLDLHVTISEVAAAFDRAFKGVSGVPRRTRTHVTRQLQDGVALTQTLTREIGTPAEITAPAKSLSVPAGYRKEAPTVGVPGRS